MQKKKSIRKDQLTPIEKLFSGKAGPLPIDTDITVEMPSSGSDEMLDSLVRELMDNHPGLTAKEAQELIDSFA